MQHCGVVPFPDLGTDAGQGGLGVFLGKEHRKLTRLYDMPFPGLGLQGGHIHFEIIGYHLLYVVDGYFPFGVLHEFLDHLLGQLQGNFLFVERGLGDQ